MEPKLTVKVRLPVCVNTHGEWYAWGSWEYDDAEMRNEVEGFINDPYAVHYIEAEVPLPFPLTVQGKVCSTPSPQEASPKTATN